MDLYQSVMEKRAFNASRAMHIGGGAITGGALGGAMGYYSPSAEDVKKDPNIRTKSMVLNGGLSAILGGAIGNDVHAIRDFHRRQEAYGGGRNAGSGGGGHNWGGDPATQQRAQAAASAFDPQHHGKGVGRMWDTIVNSTELHDPVKHQAAVDFMKTVGRPGANVDALKQHMSHFQGDTLTGQMMNVLFHKHHGDKVASLQAQQKIASWDVYATYGVW